MQDNPNEVVRAHILVRGRVQGVGFRAYVESEAQQLGISGWVRNVGSDIVEAFAEGRREIVEQFVEAVRQGPRMARVDESTVDWEAATGEFTGFGVKRNI